MHNRGQSSGTEDADINAPEAWAISSGGPHTVVVGVIDTGIDYNHEDLQGRIWTNPGEVPGNGIDDDGNGYIDDVHGYDFVNGDGDPMDDNGHGTHCAGTIGAAGDNGIGVAGVHWGAGLKMMGLKFLSAGGSGSTSGAIAAVDYAVLMGATLTSNSWGGAAYSQALNDVIAVAEAQGQLFVAAAGNDDTNIDTSPQYPAGYDSAAIIAVASMDRYNSRSSFSNYGQESVHIGAPGSDINSLQAGGGYTSLSGTSMACPHVAGAASLLWSLFPSLSAQAIKQSILMSARPAPSLVGMCTTEGTLDLHGAMLQAVRRSWISVTPRSATLAPGESIDLNVTLHAQMPECLLPAGRLIETMDVLARLFCVAAPAHLLGMNTT